MIRTFTGKPRGGKSYGALKREVLDEALYGRRVIVTNLSIDPGEFQQYLHDFHPKCTFDVNTRLVIITKEQAKRFWLIRSADSSKRIEDTTIEEQKAGKFPDFGPHAGEGVLYVIDEAHVLFDARSWASNGLALTYYNSQHGKLNDDVVFITQFLALLDTRCKSFSQTYHVFRNFKFEKVFTYFRTPGYFEERVYSVEPKGGVDHDEKHEYKLDARLAKCYDTSAGVGISGRGQPEKPRVKGLHFGWLIGGVGVACVALWFVADLPAWLVVRSDGGKAAQRAIEGTHAPAVGSIQRSPALSVNHGQSNSLEASSDRPGRRDDSTVESERWVVGYIARNGKVNVVMSDGVVYTEDDEELERVNRTSVVISGKRYPIKNGTPQIGYRQQGAGAKRAPERRDTEVPDVAVPVITGRNPTVAEQSERPAAAANESTPPPQQHGSWYVDADGVNRLRVAPSL